VCKFVVSRAGEAYDARGQRSKSKFWLSSMLTFSVRPSGRVSDSDQCSRPANQFSRQPDGLPIHFVADEFEAFQLTDWGLGHVPIENHYTILDSNVVVAGPLVNWRYRHARQSPRIDHSNESVAATRRTNARWIDLGASSSRRLRVQLPFSDNVFDLVTAVETHFFCPTCPGRARGLESPETRW